MNLERFYLNATFYHITFINCFETKFDLFMFKTE